MDEASGMNDSMSFCCSRAMSSDTSDVVRVHLDVSPGFFLSELGAPFLRVMCKSFLMDANGIYLVHRAEIGEMDGFAVGTLTSQVRDRWLALRFLPEFLVASIPATLVRAR
jgi:hypothetical protein